MTAQEWPLSRDSKGEINAKSLNVAIASFVFAPSPCSFTVNVVVVKGVDPE